MGQRRRLTAARVVGLATVPVQLRQRPEVAHRSSNSSKRTDDAGR